MSFRDLFLCLIDYRLIVGRIGFLRHDFKNIGSRGFFYLVRHFFGIPAMGKIHDQYFFLFRRRLCFQSDAGEYRR